MFCRGARLVEDLNRVLPLPPYPPWAAIDLLARRREILEDEVVLGVADDRAGRNQQHQIFGRSAVPIVRSARIAVVGFPQFAMRKRQQAIDIFLRKENDAAAVAAVAAVGSAVFDVFLPPEADQPVAAFARLDLNFHFIQKLHKCFLAVEQVFDLSRQI